MNEAGLAGTTSRDCLMANKRALDRVGEFGWRRALSGGGRWNGAANSIFKLRFYFDVGAARRCRAL